MKIREFWLRHVEVAWRRRRIIWLAGVRRVGKTVLCQSLPDIEYFDCELPRVRRQMEDPEEFLNALHGKRVVLDEVHRLENPSETLKVAADHYRDVQIIATGSSTLGASVKFRDTLTGRKTDLWLTPMVEPDLADFGVPDMGRRLLRGGLPPFFLAEPLPERDFQEWMDGYWAKDIQELFRIERRQSFQRFAELLFASSGGIFEATRYAGPCEVSRTTIANYLRVLEDTFVAHVIRPYASNPTSEIVSAPKVYGFDTGFMCYYRGWDRLRPADLGVAWEHYVLNELHGRLQTRRIRYWRDKRGHEVDFVLAGRGAGPATVDGGPIVDAGPIVDVGPTVVECKWKAEAFDPVSLKSFRRRYASGSNYVVASDVPRTWSRSFDGIEVRFVSLEGLIDALTGPAPL